MHCTRASGSINGGSGWRCRQPPRLGCDVLGGRPQELLGKTCRSCSADFVANARVCVLLFVAGACTRPAPSPPTGLDQRELWRRWQRASGTGACPRRRTLLQVVRWDPSWGQHEPPLRHVHVDAATAATTGQSRLQPRPAHSSPPMLPGGNIGGRPESPHHRVEVSFDTPPLPAGGRDWAAPSEDAGLLRHCGALPRMCESASRHCGEACICADTAERVTARRPPAHVLRSLDWSCMHVLETWPRHRESGRSLVR